MPSNNPDHAWRRSKSTAIGPCSVAVVVNVSTRDEPEWLAEAECAAAEVDGLAAWNRV